MAGDVPRRPDAAAPFQSTLASTVRVVLATATDGELCNVVGALDGLSSPAAADALLTELRPRIGGLRPSRPLRFSRLLALPLEPVLVPSTAWGSDRSGIPRAALRPVIEAVRSALGGEATRIESAARGCTMADTALVALLGPYLWRLAAAAQLRLPSECWTGAGLPPDAAEAVLPLCRTRWRDAADQSGG